MNFKRKAAPFVAGMLVLWLSGCVQFSIPAADPDKHPRAKTEPSEDLDIAYFRYGGRWHQMRVSFVAEEPKKSGKGQIVRFSSAASLSRYNRKTNEYDIPAKFVKTEAFEEIYFERVGGIIEARMVLASQGGSGVTGWGTQPYTEHFADISSPIEHEAREHTITGFATATFHPNGSPYQRVRLEVEGDQFQARLDRSWSITAGPAGKIDISPVAE